MSRAKTSPDKKDLVSNEKRFPGDPSRMRVRESRSLRKRDIKPAVRLRSENGLRATRVEKRRVLRGLVASNGFSDQGKIRGFPGQVRRFGNQKVLDPVEKDSMAGGESFELSLLFLGSTFSNL